MVQLTLITKSWAPKLVLDGWIILDELRPVFQRPRADSQARNNCSKWSFSLTAPHETEVVTPVHKATSAERE